MQVSAVTANTFHAAAELAQLRPRPRTGPNGRGGPVRHERAFYATGPDNQLYAIGGEASIDAAPVRGDPQATIQKMLTVIAAANAPADPSPQDQQVAAQAAAALAVAQSQAAPHNYGAAEQSEDAASSLLANVVG